MKVSILTTILFSSLLPLDTAVGQDEGLSVDKQHIAEVVESHLAGLEGWRKGDFLVRISENGDGRYFKLEEQDRAGFELKYVKGPEAMSTVTRFDILVRMIFDLDQEKALIINRGENEVRIFNGLDEDVGTPVIGLDDRVLLYDKAKGVGLSRLKAGVIHELRELPELPTMITSWGVMDVRGLGCTSGGPWDTDRLKQRVQLVGNIDTIKTITNVGKNRYRVLTQVDDGSAVPWRAYVDWDLQRNVPLKYELYVSNREGVPPTKTGTAEWESIDGNYLPVSSRVSNREIKKIEGNRFMMLSECTIDVHWFSFNQDLPDELFEVEILSNRKKLDELLSQDVFEKSSDDHSAETKK